MDFVPLLTIDYKMAFCLATNALPTDIQRKIYNECLGIPPVIPTAPIKRSTTLKIINQLKSKTHKRLF